MVARRSPYAVLNLPRTRDGDERPIGDDDIRDAHKRLSRILHPDKRPPGKEREDTQELFVEMQHACESLNDEWIRSFRGCAMRRQHCICIFVAR